MSNNPDVGELVPSLICFRRTERRGRRHWFFRGYNDWYELRLDDGPIEELNSPALLERFRATEEWNMVDYLECVSQALRSFREGDREAWIIFPCGAKRSAASL